MRLLLGRESERLTLAGMVSDAGYGNGGLVIVEGPAGIGKTSLLAAAQSVAHEAEMPVLTARGSALEREFPFGVVRQLFEPSLARMTDEERERILSGPASRLGWLFSSAQQAPSSDATFAILHGLYWLVANMCEHRPMLLTVDDLQWADTPSIRFIAYLLPRLPGLPLLVAAARRLSAPGDVSELLDEISLDPQATVVRPKPLNSAQSAQVIREVVVGSADDAFCASCHAATGGNPLLLRELVHVVTAEGISPTVDGVSRLWEVAPHAVERRIKLWLARLSPSCGALARAVAVLGDDVELAQAAALAGLDGRDGLQALTELVGADILKPGNRTGFVHPLVRAAVYEGLPLSERGDAHARAARLLLEVGAPPEQVAAHLLLCPASGDPAVVSTLVAAADDAVRRGSSEGAVAYLERCLAEPQSATQRAATLVRLGRISLHINVAKAVDHLEAAMNRTDDPVARGEIAELLGGGYLLLNRSEDATRLVAEAMAALPDGHTDLKARLEAEALNNQFSDPGRGVRTGYRISIATREGQAASGVGARMLGCMQALSGAYTIEPREDVERWALDALDDGVMISEANGSNSFVCGMWALLATDSPRAMPLLDRALADAHERGSIYAYATVMQLRSLAWLWRGSLAEAEADGRESIRALTAGRLDYDRWTVASTLANSLIEQGKLPSAAEVLGWAGPVQQLPHAGAWFWNIESHARLTIANGRFTDALELAQLCGSRFTAHGARNPAITPWRSAVALCLHHLGRTAEALPYAHEEVELARAWGTPRAVGRALRIAGLVTGGESGLALIQDAVKVLEPSPARLEYAKALTDFGAALRRDNQRIRAREPLEEAIRLASLCGATPTAELAETELRATGARPRRAFSTGVDALTVSERRVAEMAAIPGTTNRDIAQALFVTTKTVEIHLSAAYRKLDITKRSELAGVLNA